MAIDTPAERTAQALLEEDDIIVVPDLKVGEGGRLHIPKDTRERHDIEEGEYVDCVLALDTSGGE